MKIESLLSKITLIFIVAFLLLCGHFFAFIKFQDKQLHHEIVNSHKKLSKYFFINRSEKQEVIDYLHSIDFEMEKNFKEVLYEGQVVSLGKRGFETIYYKDSYYFHLLTPHFRILFKDLTAKKPQNFGYLIFLSIFIVLIALYIWLIKSLKPLQDLKENIVKFSNGQANIDCSSSKKDEIAQVSNEFDKAVKKINLLQNSRQLFLRSIMHELKTPLAKGRIVTELIEDEKQKQRMKTIFEKLDYLINDFSKIEQIVSQNYQPNILKYDFKSIYDKTIEMLMINNQKNTIELNIKDDEIFYVDIELFSLVFKNLIDNAFKYSYDKKITISKVDNQIYFISNGDILTQELENYFKPYHNEINLKKDGMGLGLYIVKTILDLHKMKFTYEYKDNMNIFKIDTNY